MEIKLTNGTMSASINTFAAEMKSLRDENGNEYIWDGSDYWKRSAIILFPVCGRLFNKKYTYNGKEYSMDIHGFAKDNDFKVAEKAADKIVFELTENEETLKQYPFKFLLYYSIYIG